MHQNQANGSKGRNTANKVPGNIPFAKGYDPRRNLNGRPKSFDEVRALAQELAHQKQNGREAIINVLEGWRDSPEPSLQKAFVEYAFGKVPDKIESTIDDKRMLKLHWPHERQDLAKTNGSTDRSN